MRSIRAPALDSLLPVTLADTLPEAVALVMVYDTARQVYVLTRQFRIGPEAEILEIAAGTIRRRRSPRNGRAPRDS